MDRRVPLFAFVLHLGSFVGAGTQHGNLETQFLKNDMNSVISPYSIYSTLLPLKLGSDGATRIELEKALEGFDFQSALRPSDKSSIRSSTLVFASKEAPLLPSYKEALRGIDVKSVEGFDFRNYAVINDYVKNATGGLIPEIVGEGTFTEKTKLVIVNGVYFESPWRTPFESSLRSVPFETQAGLFIDVQMMFQKASNYYARVNQLGATVLDLPYRSLDTIMRIYLPYTSTGLPELLKNIQDFNTSSIRLKLTELEVYLPKFKIESELKLSSGLKQLGLQSLTKTTANLSKMSSKPLRIDEIICKSVIEVTQRGTRAGAATAAFIIPLSGFTADEFIANRPFYFEVRDTSSKNVYFSGTYTSPVEPTDLGFKSFHANRDNSDPAMSAAPEEEPEDAWWVHKGRPEYLLVPKDNLEESTPRFQQPEPFHPSGIRFLYPSRDPNTQLVIDTHLKNASSINSVPV